MGAPQKQKKRVRRSAFRRSMRLFMRSRLGMAGILIIAFFFFIALFAPYLTSNDPILTTGVSSPFSIPDWATIFPNYHGLPPTLNPLAGTVLSSSNSLSYWSVAGSNYSLSFVSGKEASSSNISTTVLQVRQAFVPNSSLFKSTLLPAQPLLTLSQSFDYTRKPPTEFRIYALVRPVGMTNVTSLYTNFIISAPSHNYSLGSLTSYVIRSQISFPRSTVGSWHQVNLSSFLLPGTGNPDFPPTVISASKIFSASGTYRFGLQIMAVGSGKAANYTMDVALVTFQVPGRTYGLLGTDNQGRDVWSQFVWGSQVSFLVGVLSALGAVGIGTAVGLVAGLSGGWVDELVSRITDFFLVIPFLPLAIAVIFILSQNVEAFKLIYYWIIILFVVLSWPSVTRIVRSQVLTVKERQYVEASRALGGKNTHIMGRHILPNVLGLVYSQAALLVPGFILTEAALDYLAVGTHPITTITWGVMLTNALNFAIVYAQADYVWWWFLPPGIAIALLSLAFVMVGFALDRVFNPKLRER